MGTDIAAVFLRIALSVTMLAHGYNHAFRGGRIAGTGRWFDSIGIHPGRVHAMVATLTELGAGALILVGFVTPLAAAGVIGTMTVALIANHLKNGFFIFRPGEGYEYVLVLILTGLALAGLGGGYLSLDHLFGWHLSGWRGLAIGGGAGLGGSALLLITCWRPSTVASKSA